MTISTLIYRTAAIGAAAIALSAAAGGPALAAAPHAPAARQHLVHQGMYATGYDAAVAKAHGYKIVRYADGDEQAVPINAKSHLPKGTLLVRQKASPGVVTPDNGAADTVRGNCGESWITGLQTNAHQIKLTSGFETSLPSVKYKWVIELRDMNGTSEQGDSGWLAEDSEWEGTWPNLTQYDFSVDQVVPALSYATLTDGEICYSGGPAINWDLD